MHARVKPSTTNSMEVYRLRLYGTFTFGRQRSLGTDSMLAYDPAGGAYSFSYIGYNGTMAGGGDTEDTRWDQAIKYRLAYGPLHAGAMYKFADGSGGCYSASKTWSAATCTPEQAHNAAFGFDLGGEYSRFFRGRRFPTLQSSDQRTQPFAGPSEFESAISIDRQQHQYKSHHWRQCDRNGRHRIWHRDRQHRDHGGGEI